MKFNLELENRTDETLTDFTLCFDTPRFMEKETIEGATFVKQAGSHIEIAPLVPLAPHSRWVTTLETHTSALFNLMEQPIGPYLKRAGEYIPVALGMNDMQQPDNLELSPLTLPEAAPGIIPQPLKVTATQGQFVLPISPSWSGDTEHTANAVNWLQTKLNVACALVTDSPSTVHFELDTTFEDEAYRLDLTEEQAVIRASGSAGFFYAAVSLVQLLKTSGGRVACCLIEDAPRFHYRGQFLDCARSFHGIDTVKAVIDRMASLKMNHFHWHLTDDEGWRLEIDAYPQLTEKGAWRGEEEVLEPQFGSGPHRYGGFFTKQQVREVLAYAQAREVTVIPEIDIPGHTRALIKCLPELLVEPEDTSDFVSIQQYQDNVLNPALPGTYTVLETILDEVCELFPSPIVHMGGDEVPHHVWEGSPACAAKAQALGYANVRELEGHLIRHLQQYLKQKGKKLAVWEEASYGQKIDSDAIVCAWTNREKGIAAAQEGYQVIMCPAQYTYLDMAWNRDVHEFGVLWASDIDLERAYKFEISEGVCESNIIGTQALVWTEFVNTQEKLEFLHYPRLFAIAENAWTAADNKSWDGFLPRVAAHVDLLRAQGINYRSAENENVASE
ncbi:beta-N-acetylhexosaminidase [Thaumasiovibrio subtropicus]|uniref:beta-N-acetylhexosaminidase n=1 Tax=Thaumasiovibrio subtropicus TaxID=1891207 RepID=UPI00131AAA5C|nr:beta-N-acetylhexosaminidase [Thaumasiovibrio subtropicus]